MSPSRPTATAMLVIAGGAAVSFAFALSGLQQGGYVATFFPKGPAPAHAALMWFGRYGWSTLTLLGAVGLGFVGDLVRRGAAIAASWRSRTARCWRLPESRAPSWAAGCPTVTAAGL
jgi:hypothetical protein